MTIGARIIAAAGACGFLLALPGTARADVFCTSVPTEVNTRKDGTVTLYATWRNDWITICNIDHTRDGAPPALCMAWTAQLVTAPSKGKTIGFYYTGASSWPAILTYDNSPAPNYVRFLGI